MSTYYLPIKPINFDDLKTLVLERDRVGLAEGDIPRVDFGTSKPREESPDELVLTDGKNYLWAYRNGTTMIFTRYHPNGNPEFILDVLAERFGGGFVSEHELEVFEVGSRLEDGSIDKTEAVARLEDAREMVSGRREYANRLRHQAEQYECEADYFEKLLREAEARCRGVAS